jgi:mannose/fructose/N-acetylgalactosamine-specific phosphotransferase system component IID
MWYIATIIIAIIGSFIAMAGEPMGAILFVPMIATGILYEIKQATNEKK